MTLNNTYSLSSLSIVSQTIPSDGTPLQLARIFINNEKMLMMKVNNCKAFSLTPKMLAVKLYMLYNWPKQQKC